MLILPARSGPVQIQFGYLGPPPCCPHTPLPHAGHAGLPNGPRLLRRTAMFGATFPLGCAASAAVNILELRLDAQKLIYNTRRPRYQGAQDIGTWATYAKLGPSTLD